MSTEALFTPVALGSIALRNRIVMPPLTRSRADAEGVPSQFAAKYYGARAESAGLVIAEATQVSFGAQGYCRTPGAHSAQQLAGWQRVTDAVHDAGGKIVLQIWHCGRITNHLNRVSGDAVAPSAVQAPGQMYTDQQGMQPHDVPRALTVDEIKAIIQDFADTAEKAIDIGFDGIEVHSANGYLLHQFLSTNVNLRTDEYGGSIANRIRMPLETVKAVAARVGADKTGVRVSPGHQFNGIEEADLETLYAAYLPELDKLGLAYLHVMNPTANPPPTDLVALARRAYKGRLIACGGYTGESAAALVASGQADAVGFGKAFIANPDLAVRIRTGAALNKPDESTFYLPGPKGYIDYPMLEGA